MSATTVSTSKYRKEHHRFLYEKIVSDLTAQILSGVIVNGDKLPSVRKIQQQYQVSQSTVVMAYTKLYTAGFIRPVAKSGYFVSYVPRLPALPNSSNPSPHLEHEDTSTVISKVYDGISSGNLMLSLGLPSAQLLPLNKLNSLLTHHIRHSADHGTGYEHVLGSKKLRRQVARLSYNRGDKLHEDQIIATAGCTGAMTLCLTALTQRGDTIAVESPVYFGILQLAKVMGLQVIELPTHPQTGVEIEALKAVFETKKIKLCLLISNFSNPMGGTIPEDSKKEIVRLIQHYHIPLIENDMYGDLYFGDTRPGNCRTYDESGLVLLCSSFSKTLAPGYRVGWVTPGKFTEQLRRVKFATTLSGTPLMQETIGNFLETGAYEKHLKTFRNTLYQNSLQYINAITRYFPEGTRVSRPQGGFMLWLELQKQADTAALYDKAIKMKISIAPGRMFSLRNQYSNCMRLSFGLPWTEEVNHAIKKLSCLLV